MATDDTTAAIRQAAERIAAAGQSPPRAAPDPVNLPMIRHWTQAMGDTNPIYTDPGAAAASVHGHAGRTAGDGPGLDDARAAAGAGPRG